MAAQSRSNYFFPDLLEHCTVVNIVRYCILAIQKAGLRRFVWIAAPKLYRMIFGKYNDLAMRRASMQSFSSFSFNPVLPLESETGTRFKTLFPEKILIPARKSPVHTVPPIRVPWAHNSIRPKNQLAFGPGIFEGMAKKNLQ